MLSPVEQEALALRELVALRRAGLTHGAAVALVGEATPRGPLGQKLRAAGQALSAGQAMLGDPWTDADAPISAVEARAEAIEARLEANQATRLARWVTSAALAGPLVVACTVAWVVPSEVLQPNGRPSSDLGGVIAALRWGALPAAGLLALAVAWLGQRVAPGVSALMQAADLLSGDHRGRAGDLGGPAERFMAARTAQTDGLTARRELALHLRRTGLRRHRRFTGLVGALGAGGLAAALLCTLLLAAVGFSSGIGG